MLRVYKASPAANVVVFVGGREVRTERGGRLIFLGPRTSVAMVPGGDVPINFLFTERTGDDQEVVVQGNLVVRLDAGAVVGRRNFIVEPKSGRWEDPNENEALHDDFRRLLHGLVRQEVRGRTLRANLTDAVGIERKVREALGGDGVKAAIAQLGGAVAGFFVAGVAPANAKLKEALEAEEREKMLSAADRALHDRRQQSAERERELKLYEAETTLKVEEENARLIEQKAKNLEGSARGEAEATRIKLQPFAQMPAGLVLSHSVMEMARSGHVQTFHFTPDVVNAIQAAASQG